MAFVHSSVLSVVRVALRKRKEAIDNSDTVAQSRHETSLSVIKPNWLAKEWADWAADGYPPIR